MVALEAHEAASAVVVCVDDDEEDELDVLITGCCACGDCTVDMSTLGTTGVVVVAVMAVVVTVIAGSSLARLWFEIVSGVANSMTIGEVSTMGEAMAAGEIEELLVAFDEGGGGVLIAVVVVAVVAVVALFRLVFVLTLAVVIGVGTAASSLGRLGAGCFCCVRCCCGGLAGIFSLFTSLAIDGRLVKTGGGCCCCCCGGGGPGCLVVLLEFVLNSLVLVVSMKLWVPVAVELAMTAEFTEEEPT